MFCEFFKNIPGQPGKEVGQQGEPPSHPEDRAGQQNKGSQVVISGCGDKKNLFEYLLPKIFFPHAYFPNLLYKPI
jgi:hypothetical protein